MMAVIMLSPHFSIDELTISEFAARNGIDNTPPREIVANLERLADALERVRSLLGNKPLAISSGFRCWKLNTKIGGAKNSAHTFGLAADFICPKYGTPLEVAEVIAASVISFDQVIYEFGRWVHLGLAPAAIKPRREVLTIDSQGARAGLHKIR